MEKCKSLAALKSSKRELEKLAEEIKSLKERARVENSLAKDISEEKNLLASEESQVSERLMQIQKDYQSLLQLEETISSNAGRLEKELALQRDEYSEKKRLVNDLYREHGLPELHGHEEEQKNAYLENRRIKLIFNGN